MSILHLKNIVLIHIISHSNTNVIRESIFYIQNMSNSRLILISAVNVKSKLRNSNII